MPDPATNRTSAQDTPETQVGGKHVDAAWQQAISAAARFLRIHVWKGVVGLVTSAGLVGFFLSPLKEWAFHKIWPEHAELQCYVVNKSVYVNDDFELDLTVIPQGITVSSGVIDVQYPADKINLIQPSGILQTDPITDTKVAAKLFFRAVAHGPATVDIRFNTKYGKYVVSRTLLIREVDPNHHPSRDNLTGTWYLIIGTQPGELHIEDNNGRIVGRYELENGDVGQLRGVRGLVAFQASLTNKHGEQYSVQCSLNLSEAFIELNGDFFDPRTNVKKRFLGSSRV